VAVGAVVAPPEWPITTVGETPPLTVSVEPAVVCVVVEEPLAAGGVGALVAEFVPVCAPDAPPDPVAVAVPVPVSAEPEPVCGVCESVGVAPAKPGLVAIAAPTPKATASAPTRPMNRA
jgi:hypothetical protein